MKILQISLKVKINNSGKQLFKRKVVVMAVLFANIKTTKEDMQLIMSIAKRAFALVGGQFSDTLTTSMDLEVVHSKTPLNLHKLLTTDNFNFIHDVGGIRKHLNRDTGELEDCFLPRFTIREKKQNKKNGRSKERKQ